MGTSLLSFLALLTAPLCVLPGDRYEFLAVLFLHLCGRRTHRTSRSSDVQMTGQFNTVDGTAKAVNDVNADSMQLNNRRQ